MSPDQPATGTPVSLPLEAMFMASPLPASLSRERDGLLLAVNDAWLALSGLSREAVIGRTTVELGHWPDEATRQAYVAGLADGPSQHEMCMGGASARHVRVHTSRLVVEPEPLLLVYLYDITAQVAAEQALRQANVQLQQQVELHQAVETLTASGHWTNAEAEDEVVWSAGLYTIAGLDRSRSIKRRDGRGGIHPDDMPAWTAAREAMDGRVVDFRWRRPDGREVWLRTRMSRTTVSGNPQTDFGVVQDVTAEKDAQQALASQLAFIQNTTARVPGVLYQGRVLPDGSSQFLYVSAATAEMYELDPQALRQDGRLLFSRIHPDDKKRVATSLAQAGQELKYWCETYRVMLPRKGLRWYSVNALPQRDTDGSTLWYGFASDVTEARLAEQALERQHRMLQAVQQAQAAFIESDDKRAAFFRLLDAFLMVTGSAYGFVAEVLFDEREQPYLKTHALTNIAWDEASRRLHDEYADTGLEFRNLDTLFGRALRTRDVVIANSPGDDPRAGGLPPGHPAMNAFLGMPLMVGPRLVAMVGLANQPGGYSQADVEFLQPLLGAVRQLVIAWRGHAERKRARLQFQSTSALLAEKTAALQLTLDSIDQGLTQVDAQGRVRFYNRRLLELLDLPDALLAAHPLASEVIDFQRRRGDFDGLTEALDPPAREYLHSAPGSRAPERYVRPTHSGRVLDICTRFLPGGGFVRTYTDVTHYLQAQEALRDERQRLQWVLEATRPGIWETNIETGAMVINDRWAEMLGYTVAELEPVSFDTWRRLVHPQDLARAERVLQWHWSGELPFYECDVRMRHKDGRWIWINDRGRVHRRGPEGQALYMSGTHLDIHDRVTAQDEVRALNASLERRVAERTAELERSMKDMEAISYSIAHDLRAPLRSVNGFAALIAEEGGDQLSPQAREMFGRIVRSSGNMGQMITDMLELLRVVRVEFEPAPVDMLEQAHRVIDSLATDANRAQIELGALPRVMGDATLLRQVLANLLDNALKYSRHKEAPELALGYDPQRSAFFLRDNGMGFDMARANKLFGLFQRLHAGSGVPGTGVGLAIVARIIERHGGRIWADSRPDEGTTFWWTLPLA